MARRAPQSDRPHWTPDRWRRRRRLKRTARYVGLLLLLAAALRARGRAGSDWHRFDRAHGQVSAVIDPQTLQVRFDDADMGPAAVRIVGVACRSAWSAGAQQWLSSTCAGRSVTLVIDGHKPYDARGHLRAEVYLLPDGSILCERMIEAGYAQVGTDVTSQVSTCLVKLATRAEHQGRGMWSADAGDQ